MITIKDLIIYNELKNKILVHIEELLIEKNSVLIITADSGKGKSILLKTIANQYIHFGGNILINNRVIESYDNQTFSHYVQFVKQTYPLFTNMTVFEQLFHVLYYIKKEEIVIIKNKINYLLKKLNLLNEKDKFPQELSGGQQQRIAIIQKILLNPEYLILDEPTSGLDRTSKFELLNLLLEENKLGMTLIIASHDQDTIHFFSNKEIYQF